ncbi:MAG: hypothetical protein H7843_09105 [Nitrospirota bacterium]
MSNELMDNVATMTTTGVLGNSDAQRAVAEVQGAILLAKKFPRNTVDAIRRIKNACQREGLAKSAMYTYSRGGTDITGPSIRLAEAMAQSWGNLQFGIRELEQGSGTSTVEAYCWDMETNTRQVKMFQVEHVRSTKQGVKKLSDPRDIYETVANNGARRLRACILGIIPGDVQEMAIEECEKTLETKLNLTPQGVKLLLEAFTKHGVTREQIEKRILRNAEAMTPAQYVSLLNIGNSLRDGMSHAADWFPEEETTQKPQRKSEAKKEEAKTEEPTETVQPQPPVDEWTDVESAIESADSIEEVNTLWERIEPKLKGKTKVWLMQVRDKRLVALKGKK